MKRQRRVRKVKRLSDECVRCLWDSLSSADAQHTCCCINPAINCNFPWQNTPQECCIVSNCSRTPHICYALCFKHGHVPCTHPSVHMFVCISALSLLSPRKLCTISALMRLWLNLMKSYALAIASAVSSRRRIQLH